MTKEERARMSDIMRMNWDLFNEVIEILAHASTEWSMVDFRKKLWWADKEWGKGLVAAFATFKLNPVIFYRLLDEPQRRDLFSRASEDWKAAGNKSAHDKVMAG